MKRRISQLLITLVAVAMVAAGCGNGDPGQEDPPDAGDDADLQQDADETALSLDSIYPVSGDASGGENTSLYGAGFVEESTVFFGDDEASATYVSSTELEAVAPGGEPGFVDVIVENPDGERSTLEEGFEYVSEPGPSLEIGWCNLQYPPSTTTEAGEETEPIYGHVYVEDCTDAGDCPEVDAELGWGGADVDPSADPGDWDWSGADRNADFDDDNNHEYEASITPAEPGEFGYAYRFSVDGSDWTYCDLTGTDDGFDTAEMGELVVEEEDENGDETVEIGWCNLQYPPSTTTEAGEETEPIFGHVYVEDCTDVGDCPEVDAELGWGASDVDPSADPGDWDWSGADRNADFDDDNNHEYEASITPAEPGEFGYAYRFSVDDSEWTYCDLTGTDDGFDTAEIGELVVEEEDENGDEDVEIGWCNLQYPPSTTTDVGEETEPIFGRVWVEECTGSDTECEAVTGQVGFGPQAVDPSSAPNSYEWTDAEYNPDYPSDGTSNNDEHMGTLTPSQAGTFSYVFRFSGDDGDTWTYCDLEGTDDGFDTDEAGALTVE